MTEKPIHEIREEYSAAAIRAMNARSTRLGEIRAMRQPSGDEFYLSRLDDGQRAKLLAEQKAERADQDRRELVHALRAAHAAYARDLETRREELRRRLFHVEGGGSADLLARLATASEAELASMMDIAGEAGNDALRRAVFATAHRRGLAELVLRFFAESPDGGELRDLYHELNEAPDGETISRQFEDIDRLVPPVSSDELVEPARANS